jgi:type I restriction enzyme R subunit
MHQDNELLPYPERVNANFKAWLAQARRREQPSPPNNNTGWK